MCRVFGVQGAAAAGLRPRDMRSRLMLARNLVRAGGAPFTIGTWQEALLQPHWPLKLCSRTRSRLTKHMHSHLQLIQDSGREAEVPPLVFDALQQLEPLGDEIAFTPAFVPACQLVLVSRRSLHGAWQCLRVAAAATGTVIAV